MNTFHMSKKMAIQMALHLLVWGFWFSAPLLFQGNEPQRSLSSHLHMWIPMLFSMGLFYLNYFFLIDRFLFQQRFFGYVIINLITALVFVTAAEQIRHFLPVDLPDQLGHFRPPLFWIYSRLFFSFLFIISISITIRITGRWFLLETERKNLENANLRSELSNLKMQLNPHFFFNTLNNIYSLISISPEKAQEAVHKLAKLMRYHLYETEADAVPLEGEVEFMKSYISLMQLRTTDKVKVDSSFTLENISAKVAPLLFISLVENAFKHGVSPVGESTIRFELVEKDKIISFDAWNSNYPGTEVGSKANGIGLDNLQKRLGLIYPGRYSFHNEIEDGVFHVKVVIQL